MKRLLLALSAAAFFAAALVLFHADAKLPRARADLFAWGAGILAAVQVARAVTAENRTRIPAAARRDPPVRTIAPADIPKKPGHFFTGWGIEYTWQEVQEANDITRAQTASSPDQVLMSVLARRTLRPLFLPLERLAEHMRIHGATGSGKSRFLELLGVQAIHTPGLAVAVFDPKGDHGLLNTAYHRARLTGKDFLFFSPEWPAISTRYNPLASFSAARDIPDRIKPLFPSIGEGEPYAQTQWKACLAICHALVACGITPSFRRLRRHSESAGQRELYLKLLRRLYPNGKWPAGAFDAAREYLSLSAACGRNERPVLPGFVPHEAADHMTEIILNSEWYQKMIMSFLPLVTKLSDGALGELMSHEGDLPQMTWADVERRHSVAYLHISSMTGIETGSSLVKIAFLDLLNWLGRKFAYHADTIRRTPIFLLADEFGDLVMPEFIAALNKGRSAGLTIVAASQTMADVVAKLNPSRARQIETNTRTVVQFRATDEDARTFSERAGEAPVEIISEDRNYEPGLFASGHLLVDDVRASFKQKRDVKPLAAVPPELLLALPKFHFFMMEGAKTYLGYIPVLARPPMSFLGQAAERLRQGTAAPGQSPGPCSRAPKNPEILGAPTETKFLGARRP